MIAGTSFRGLGTTAVVCTGDRAALAEARAVVESEVEAIDRACSRFRRDSELSLLNRAGGRPTRVGAVLLEAIEAAVRAAEATAGLVDPTLGASLHSAGYDRDFELVRRRDGRRFRAVYKPAAGWQTITLDRAHSVVALAPGAELDLGATAKGLAADRAARSAAAQIGAGVLVSLGGDVAVAGEAPPAGWPLKVADDHAAALDSPGPTVAISAGGLATSSTRVRRWRSGGAELHHVLDPRTGAPASTPWRSVSVAAPSCLDANVASTAAIVLGAAAPSWLEARGLPARLLTHGAAVTCVAGWPEDET